MAVSLKDLQSYIERFSTGDNARLVQNLATVIFEEAVPEFLELFSEADLLAVTLSALDFIDERRLESFQVRCFNPTQESHGWTSDHSAIEITVPDRPFLVDSVRLHLKRKGIALHHLLHPILSVERGEEGVVTEIFQRQSEASIAESYELYLIDRIEDPALLQQLQTELSRILGLVVAVTDDFPAMRGKARQAANALSQSIADAGSSRFPDSASAIAEYAEFLRWIDAENFVYLGYREYEVYEEDGREFARIRDDSCLGILRDVDSSRFAKPVAVEALPAKVIDQMAGAPLLLVAKANTESPIRRSGLMDYIGLKEFDEQGRFVGEKRFLGLFSSHAYTTAPTDIPILREKLRKVLELDRARTASYDYKQIVAIFNSIPLGELFSLNAVDLHRDIRDIMSIEKERGVRLQIRLDAMQRGYSVTVIMPRERFNSQVRLKIQSHMESRLGATYSDYRLAMVGADEERVRFHFFFSTAMTMDEISFGELEREVAELTRTWDDRLGEALEERFGDSAQSLARKYSRVFPEGYKAEVPIENAVRDVPNLEALGNRDFLIDLINPVKTRYREKTTHLRIYHPGTLVLAEIFPVLENLGLKIFEQISYQLEFSPGRLASIDIFRVQDSGASPIDIDRDGRRLREALVAILTNAARSDRLNRLVLSAGLSIREVALLKTYRGHLFQLVPSASLTFITETFLNYPECCQKVLRFFECKFDPSLEGDREELAATAHREAIESLNSVSTLPEDTILRSLIDLVHSTLRTNYFLNKSHISIKVESNRLTWIVEPRPLYEIFVWSPNVEAVHLRGGPIARGGLRWSDRPDDFRTEVLGLMKTQMSKNALIVPEGSKGGFVLKNAPLERDQLIEYVKSQYQTFIRGLLDITDNIIDSKPVHPGDLVIYDDYDPYLVVAADKGTATFSDLANSISREYGFWLGDAFASGGSNGYDHKKEGITAKGAWECVQRHFRELGMDPHREEFTVAGIGDMSGDVFGNGLIFSDKIRLVAAFNHTHIFLDPSPDASSSFQERIRLFADPSLSWADYDDSLISPGGGVFLRKAKSIDLSSEARELLGLDEESVSGQEIVRRILQLPVDLLWNGGIGTYVKATNENNSDVGDPNNNGVRIDAPQIRARVIGEGGNLGFTQLARIEYSLNGGRINTDAIDNSGGVDMSDHEVNLKILLSPAVRFGKISADDRNELLVRMTDDVSKLVLANNYSQALCLSQAEHLGVEGIGTLEALQHQLSSHGRLKPNVEFLPNSRTLEQRRRNGQGYTRPELAILLAYAKMDLKRSLLTSNLLGAPVLERHLTEYFPELVRGEFPDELRSHQLKREIIATRLTNLLIDRLGIAFIHGIAEDTQGQPDETLNAVLATHEILELDKLFDRLFALDKSVPATAQYRSMACLNTAAKGIVHWLILSGEQEESLDSLVTKYYEPMRELRARLDQFLPPSSERKRFLSHKKESRDAGYPEDLATDIAASDYWASCMGVADISVRTSVELERAAKRFYGIGDLFSLGWIRDQLSSFRATSRWEAVALNGIIADLRHLQRQLTVLSFAAGNDRDWKASLVKSQPVLVNRINATIDRFRDQNAVDLSAGSVIARLMLQLQRRLESQYSPQAN